MTRNLKIQTMVLMDCLG